MPPMRARRPRSRARRLGWIAVAALLAALAAPFPAAPAAAGGFDPIGRFPVTEGSGVVASRRYPGVVWAHLDSGNPSVLYALRVRDGALVDLTPGVRFRQIQVRGARNVDWEDIAIDGRGLWIADLGNNACRRSNLAILRLPEPDPYRADAVTVAASYPVRWPDAPSGCTGHNAEALFLLDGNPYVVSKTTTAAVYRLPTFRTSSANTLRKIVTLAAPGGGFSDPPTAADVSAGRLVLATAFSRLYVYEAADASLHGDALVRSLVARPPRWSSPYRRDGRNEKVEGAAFLGGGHDLLLLSEYRGIFNFPAGFYQAARA